MSRKPKSEQRAIAESTLAQSVTWAAQHLNLITQGSIAKPNAVVVDVCKYVLNQQLGMPRQKTETSLHVEGMVKFVVGKGYLEHGIPKQDGG